MSNPYNPHDAILLVDNKQITSFAITSIAPCLKAAVEITPHASIGTRRFRLHSPTSSVVIEVELYSDSPSIKHIEKLFDTPRSQGGKVTVAIEGNKPEPITNKLVRFFKG